MGFYVVHALDKANSLDLRLANRPAHLKWVRSFSDIIAAAGPLYAEDGETFVGSMFIVAFETLDEVKAWTNADPYTKAGLFARVDIHPFDWVIGERPT